MSEFSEILQLWAKKRGTPELRYPLLFHLADTAMVASEMWNKLLQDGSRNYCSDQIGLSQGQARKLISFWAGLHDIGKASPAFQNQTENNRHDILTAYILKTQFNFDKQIAVTLGGHHGIFPRSEELSSTKIKKDAGTDYYATIRQELFNWMAQICGIEQYRLPHRPQNQALFMFLAGFTSIADWIASNETFFPLDNQKASVAQQVEDSRKHASEALRRLDWSRWQPLNKPGKFTGLFPDIKEIRPVQREVIDLANRICRNPGLVIIEAPTGEGKTEAAIYLADTWNTYIGQKGCYFALPTQATSNQMFGRFGEYLQRRYPDKIVNYLLLHGHASLSSEFQELRQNEDRLFMPGKIYENSGYDKVSPNIVAAEWFTHRKRGLLAPFGLGTIDQGLLAVLQTRHVFVRLFGLAGKTIIIDEVHAYDAYMTTLLERLLEWLAALGSSVILLSATLPKSRRDGLLEAYLQGLNIKAVQGSINSNYPRISWLTAGGSEMFHIDTSQQSTRIINLEWADGSLPEEPYKLDNKFPLGIKLQEALSKGGCAAVVCNTIEHAQKIYQSLKSYFPGIADDGLPELDLLHARFLWRDRTEREKRSLVRFGKPGSTVKFDDGSEKPVKRPNRAVLVATQIIEQSLDLDFDLMVTEMAPVDLLLQRSGRLQRHDRPERKCYSNNPTLWICRPVEKQDGTPDFGGGTEAVYERHILLRSWIELKDRHSIAIPGEVEYLIEAVYGERDYPSNESENIKRDWKESAEKLRNTKNEYVSKARTMSILPPYYEDDILEDFNRELEEDDPSLNESLQALTRLTEPTISVICLYGTRESNYLDSEFRHPINMDIYPDMELVKQLLYCSVTISRRGLVQILVNENPIPEEWRKNALLRHHALLFFNGNNTSTVGNSELKLDSGMGLLITKIGE